MTSEQTANAFRGLTVTWHFLAATVFVFLSTMLAAMAVRGYAPLLSGSLSAVFLATTVLSAFAGYGLQHMKRWAAYLSHILTGVIAIGALALILMPHYAPEIAPRTNLPFCAVVLLTSMACLVSGHLAIRSKGATR